MQIFLTEYNCFINLTNLNENIIPKKEIPDKVTISSSQTWMRFAMISNIIISKTIQNYKIKIDLHDLNYHQSVKTNVYLIMAIIKTLIEIATPSSLTGVSTKSFIKIRLDKEGFSPLIQATYVRSNVYHFMNCMAYN